MSKQKIKAVLIDLSGTLHIGDSIIPNSTEALNELTNSGCFVRFVTNTTKESRNALHSRLLRMGLNVNKEHIYTTLTAARNLVKDRNLTPLMLVAQEALDDFRDVIKTNPQKYDSVIVGLAPDELYYNKINDAFRVLMDGAPLIALNVGKYYAREDGLAIGAGCFVRGLEYSAQTKAEVVGKPNKAFFKSALCGQDIACEETIMIGDDVSDDVRGALEVGMNAILVRTGKYRPNDECKIEPLQPTAVVDSFPAAVDFIKSTFEIVPQTLK